MGNSGSTATNPTVQLIRRNESFGSSPKKFQKANTQLLLEVDGNSKNGSFGSSDFLLHDKYVRRRSSGKKSNRSQSLEQRSIMNGSHSPSSSQSSSNSYLNAIVTEKGCLRQSTQPKFQISGDLNPHQVNLVKRTWKQTLKSANEDENEMACRLLLRIFQLDHRNQVLFGLADIPQAELLNNQLFLKHVKAIEPTLSSVMSHPANATNLSKYLQQLGGRHVQYTGVTYKCSYWKTFVQALLDIVGLDKSSGDTYEAFFILASFCVEQMRIGYKIEYLLQREAERIALAQQKKRDAANDGFSTPKKQFT